MVEGAGSQPGAAALHLLRHLGWNFLSAEECLALRGGTHAVLLWARLAEVLQTRRFDYKGRSCPLSSGGVDQIVRQLSALSLADGLLCANEQIYRMLALGLTVTETMPDGKRHQPTVALIDWHDPAANRWDVAEAPALLSAHGTHACAPGLVCFVNGIPLAVIEAGATVHEGIVRHLHHQRQDEIPQLFAYAQLLLAVDPAQGRYGTTGTPAAWWARWREEEFTDAQMAGWKNPALDAQGRLLAALLQPMRLLEFLRVFVLFDRKAGKVVARPPQILATRALIAHLHACPPGGRRDGGIVWHAAGSGGSFTMAFLAKALVLHPHLADCRVVVVTDRAELEDRLARNCRGSGTFGTRLPVLDDHSQGSGKGRAGTARELAWRIGQGSERIVFAPARKFGPALRLPECHNPATELVVLVDAGGWYPGSRGGEAAERLRQALPQAACVVFTDTPLRQQEKQAHPFGPIVHAYPAQQAVDDGVVLPLRYEERLPPGGVAGRIEWIARDIAAHFSRRVKPLGLGLKGLVATASTLDAFRYKRALDETGLVSSELLVKAPGRRQGAHEARVLGCFGRDGDPDLLIVADRLLTAVAEPRTMVLYIDQPLQGHALMRAMAGVNRLGAGKRHGVLLDYRGVLRELAPGTAGGYEPGDVEGLVQPLHEVDDERAAPQAREPAAVYSVQSPGGGVGEVQGRAQTYLGIFRQAAGEPGFAATAAERWLAEASEADRVVQDAVLEHSLNAHDAEAAIRQALLPRLFGLMGLDRARTAVDQVARAMRADPVTNRR